MSSVYQHLYTMKCIDKVGVLNYLTKMVKLCKTLVGMKSPISDTEFATLIRGSLPESYKLTLQSFNAAVQHHQEDGNGLDR